MVWLPLLASAYVAEVSPVAVAAMLYVPFVPLAVKVDDVACPVAPVVWVHEYACGLELHAANVALAPLLGAVKVTTTPDTPLPYASVAVATSWLVNALLTVADWLAPDVAVNVVALAGLTEKAAEVPVMRPWVAVRVVVCGVVEGDRGRVVDAAGEGQRRLTRGAAGLGRVGRGGVRVGRAGRAGEGDALGAGEARRRVGVGVVAR